MADDSLLPPLAEAEGEPHAQEAEAEEGCFTALVLQSFRADVEASLASALLPAAREISMGMNHIEAQANQAVSDSRQEMQEAESELARVSSLVHSFQQVIAQFLQ